jgi:hypothetical protein
MPQGGEESQVARAPVCVGARSLRKEEGVSPERHGLASYSRDAYFS